MCSCIRCAGRPLDVCADWRHVPPAWPVPRPHRAALARTPAEAAVSFIASFELDSAPAGSRARRGRERHLDQALEPRRREHGQRGQAHHRRLPGRQALRPPSTRPALLSKAWDTGSAIETFIDSSPAIGDLNSDGCPEVLVGAGNEYRPYNSGVHVFDCHGQQAPALEGSRPREAEPRRRLLDARDRRRQRGRRPRGRLRIVQPEDLLEGPQRRGHARLAARELRHDLVVPGARGHRRGRQEGRSSSVPTSVAVPPSGRAAEGHPRHACPSSTTTASSRRTSRAASTRRSGRARPSGTSPATTCSTSSSGRTTTSSTASRSASRRRSARGTAAPARCIWDTNLGSGQPHLLVPGDRRRRQRRQARGRDRRDRPGQLRRDVAARRQDRRRSAGTAKADTAPCARASSWARRSSRT